MEIIEVLVVPVTVTVLARDLVPSLGLITDLFIAAAVAEELDLAPIRVTVELEALVAALD